MILGTIIALTILTFTTVWLYNRLVRYKNLVAEAWSNIDVQLKRRYDLLTKLVEVVKGYASYEKGLLESVITLRSRVNSGISVKDSEQASGEISGFIKKVFLLAEAYPDLKANNSFIDLQKNISETEDQIQFSRRYYNGTVRNYNICIQTFPPNIIANLLNFKAEEFFELENSKEKNVPQDQI
jgi:LemA protein